MQRIPANPNQYRTTYIKANQAHSPVVETGKGTVLNFALTIPESMFLVSVKGMVQWNLEQGNNLIFLATSESMQMGFNEWVGKTFPAKNFTNEELSLKTIVPSVWEKTKTHVQNELAFLQNKVAIDDESEWQVAADQNEKSFIEEGRTGKMFTERQAKFLLTATENLSLTK